MVSGKVSNMSTLEAPPVDKKVSKEEEFETLKREERALLTPVGDVQHDSNLSTKVTVQH